MRTGNKGKKNVRVALCSKHMLTAVAKVSLHRQIPDTMSRWRAAVLIEIHERVSGCRATEKTDSM